MIKQKVGSYFETSLGSISVISKNIGGESKAIFVTDDSIFSLQDLKDIIYWAEKDPDEDISSTRIDWQNYQSYSFANAQIQNTGTGNWTYKIIVNRRNKSHIDTQYLWMSCDEFHDVEHDQSEFLFKDQSKYNLCKEWLLSKMWMPIK